MEGYIRNKLSQVRPWIIPILLPILIVVNVVILVKLVDSSQTLSEQQSITIKTKSNLREANRQIETINKEKTEVKSSLREERLRTEKLEKENKGLKANLQAKKAKQAELAKAQVAVRPTQAAPVAKVSGSKADWLAASGIPESEWGHADYLVNKESSWNPNAVNASSGACGLGQQLPCGKWSGAWNDPVAALSNMHGYVLSRYGSWSAAVAHSNAVGWY